MMRSALTLALAALFAAGLLAVVHQLTHERIAAENARLALARLAAVLPVPYDNDPVSDQFWLPDARFPGGGALVHRARRADQVLAVAVETRATDGYSGDIELLVGVDRELRITTVRVLEHRETPGLGDFIDIERGRWILSFDRRHWNAANASEWAVRKDGGIHDQFTGATITPRAVVGAVRRTLELITEHRDLVFAAEPQPDRATEPSS